MEITLSQSDSKITKEMYVQIKSKEKRNMPWMVDFKFAEAPTQRVVLSLVNRYATKFRLVDATPGFPFYATMAISLTVPTRLVTFLKELDKNQRIMAKIKVNEVNRLVKNATIKSVHRFLAVQKLLAEK
jgi:hypothetical protein